jgi:hypothetical protein
MVFIESKKTHIMNCITLQYLFFFSVMSVFFCQTITYYNVVQFPHHLLPYCTSDLYSITAHCIYTDCLNTN